MNNDSIILECEEYISIIKALEYLAYKWEPYVDYDEILTGQDGAQIIVKNQFHIDNLFYLCLS